MNSVRGLFRFLIISDSQKARKPQWYSLDRIHLLNNDERVFHTWKSVNEDQSWVSRDFRTRSWLILGILLIYLLIYFRLSVREYYVSVLLMFYIFAIIIIAIKSKMFGLLQISLKRITIVKFSVGHRRKSFVPFLVSMHFTIQNKTKIVLKFWSIFSLQE